MKTFELTGPGRALIGMVGAMPANLGGFHCQSANDYLAYGKIFEKLKIAELDGKATSEMSTEATAYELESADFDVLVRMSLTACKCPAIPASENAHVTALVKGLADATGE